jgi:8-oxo-dGTP pyrophosphatase MutT (NUDIX family)
MYARAESVSTICQNWDAHAAELLAERRSRPTGNAVIELVIDNTPNIVLVVSENGGRMRELESPAGGSAATFPKGGIERRDKGRLVRTACREACEEVGVEIIDIERHLVGPIWKPLRYIETDSKELARLRGKDGWEEADGKTHFPYHFRVPCRGRPKFQPPRDEIHRVVLVRSIAELRLATSLTPQRLWMESVIRAHSILPDTHHLQVVPTKKKSKKRKRKPPT